MCDLEPYWEATRRVYAPFESGLASPTGRVYTHEIPGGQLSNLRQQAIALGLAERFEQINDMYTAANDIRNNIVKVTPSSKVVGDLALHLVAVGADPQDFAAEPGKFDVPDSLIGFLSGEFGDPPGGWPEPFRSKALNSRQVRGHFPDLTLDQRTGLAEDRRTTLNTPLFPCPTRGFAESRQGYGDLSVLPTRDYLYGLRACEAHPVEVEEGKTLILGFEAISEADERGIRTVMCTINGQLRPINIRDRSISHDAPTQEEAVSGNPGHALAAFDGVVTIAVGQGAQVEAGATIEAMKMEASITAHTAGTMERLVVRSAQQVEGGDLLLVLEIG